MSAHLAHDSAVQLRSPSRVRSCPYPGSIALTEINRRYLSYLVLPKPTNLASSSNGDTPREKEKEKEKEREHSSRISGAISHSITSIGDVFRDVTARDGSKNVKFPEKLIKVLEQRLENIAMGKDPTYVPPPFRATLARFLLTVSKVIRTSSSEERWPPSMSSSKSRRSADR